MSLQLTIMNVFIACVIATQLASDYEPVSWNNKRKLWQVEFFFKGKNHKSYFQTELDAAKKLNKICDKIELAKRNPKICDIQKNEKTSQYKGVSWHRDSGRWYVLIYVKGQKRKYGGMFIDELDAAKRVNQLCKEFRIPLQNRGISAIPNQQYQKKEKTSKYTGVYYDKKNRKWHARLGKTSSYGGRFKYELDAAKRVNQLCEELEIPLKNTEINAIPNEKYQKKKTTSQFKWVHWNNRIGKWCVRVYMQNEKRKYGGMFNNELDAAQKVNQLCLELGIPPQNPGINLMSNQYQKKELSSQYNGVYWNKQHEIWYVRMCLEDQKKKYGGRFHDEVGAAKRVNDLCEKFGIPHQNPGISGIPKEQYQFVCTTSEKISQYKGVCWHKKTGKWTTLLQVKGKKFYGGLFEDELDAAKGVNQVCEKLGIPQKNLTISATSNQKYEESFRNYDRMQSEFEDLIAILGKNNDPTSTIQKNLFAAMNYGEQAIMTKINFCTKDGESALSIAAKHGFSNVVKFLISKGAEKEHFTNEHQTAISLAVSHDHLNVVQVLFEEWISPNSHEKPYLHLSPIFNVKSREIAQLLIDNDAVTHEIYNNKNQSPLTVASQNGYLDVVEFFLDDGLDINHLDSDNKTPLFYALTNKHHKIANLLISKGAQNEFHLK